MAVTPNFGPLVTIQNNQVVPASGTALATASSTTTPGTPGVANPQLTEQNAGVINDIVNQLLTNEATAVKDQYSATAEQQTSTGDIQEGEAYANAATVAASNADIAAASGQIQQFQEMRKAAQTIGEQKAVVAGAGFADSGSSLLLAQDSMRQAHLQSQIIGENSLLQQGGFLEQEEAAKAESTAANTSGNAALTLSQADAATATLLKSDTSAEAQAIASLFPNTPQADIAVAAASGTPLSATDLEGQAASLTGQSLGTSGINYATSRFTTGWLSLL